MRLEQKVEQKVEERKEEEKVEARRARVEEEKEALRKWRVVTTAIRASLRSHRQRIDFEVV